MDALVRRFALVALLLGLPAANASAGAWEISPFARYVTNAEFDFIFDASLPNQSSGGSRAQFTWQLGAGVKKMTSDTMGFRLQAANAPTCFPVAVAGLSRGRGPACAG